MSEEVHFALISDTICCKHFPVVDIVEYFEPALQVVLFPKTKTALAFIANESFTNLTM